MKLSDDSVKIESVRNDAIDEIWGVVIQNYPQIKSGDFPPDESHRLNEAVTHAIQTWLDANETVNTPPAELILYAVYRWSKQKQRWLRLTDETTDKDEAIGWMAPGEVVYQRVEKLVASFYDHNK